MNKSLSAAITTMLLVTSTAWGASPESQAVRPMGDNMPDPSPTEQADQMRERYDDGPRRDDEMRSREEEMRKHHGQGQSANDEGRWKDTDHINSNGKERGAKESKY